MGLNKAQILFEKCKRVAGDNTKCLSILLKLLDEDREDILDQITAINQQQYGAITPAGIVSMYENKCKEDIHKFIAIYDKAMEDSQYIRKNFYDGYEKGIQDYLTY